MAVATETLSVTLSGTVHEMAVLSFIDRRGRRPHRRKQWLLVRGVERLLFGVGAGDRSTGAFQAHLSKCSMSEGALVSDKACVEDETLTQAEFDTGARSQMPQETHRCKRAHLLLSHLAGSQC